MEKPLEEDCYILLVIRSGGEAGARELTSVKQRILRTRILTPLAV
jgi:hypothetical protein